MVGRAGMIEPWEKYALHLPIDTFKEAQRHATWIQGGNESMSTTCKGVTITREGTWIVDGNSMREFETGATRGSDWDKLDYEGFSSPLAWERYAQYLHKHRIQADGVARASDNWQKGIPRDAYIKSAFRHFMAWWLLHRGHAAPEELEEALCALLFNVQGYLYETLKRG